MCSFTIVCFFFNKRVNFSSISDIDKVRWVIVSGGANAFFSCFEIVNVRLY